MSGSSVTLSLRAEADIRQIAAHVAEDNAAAALRLADILFDACADLSFMPERYAIVPEFAPQSVRRRPVGDYLVFYTVRPGQVFVVRVLHGRRNYVALLGDEAG